MANLARVSRFASVLAAALFSTATARADAVTDWNQKAVDIIVAARLTPPGAAVVVALVQSSVYEAVNGVTKRYPAAGAKKEAQSGASVDAAVAAANHVALSKALPSQQAAIESAYQAALAAIPDGKAKTDGIAAGEKGAITVLAQRSNDAAGKPETYRPLTSPGVYVPTSIAIATQWPERKPWLMASADQFRPGPPPDLKSEIWARDYNEIKRLGDKVGANRTAEQTAIARYWESTQPPIYQGVVRSAANAPGREITQNARLFAAVAQALDDAYIAVFDAKYHYSFWRPVTAIRNGDKDGNDATERDASWPPFIDTPPHPEYPCAHCILSGALAAVVEAEFAGGPLPVLSAASPTADGASRSWTKLEDFTQEVANARIWGGVHFRNSTEVGTAMGRKVGALTVAKFLAR
jgi:hypothetical protein